MQKNVCDGITPATVVYRIPVLLANSAARPFNRMLLLCDMVVFTVIEQLASVRGRYSSPYHALSHAPDASPAPRFARAPAHQSQRRIGMRIPPDERLCVPLNGRENCALRQRMRIATGITRSTALCRGWKFAQTLLRQPNQIESPESPLRVGKRRQGM